MLFVVYLPERTDIERAAASWFGGGFLWHRYYRPSIYMFFVLVFSSRWMCFYRKAVETALKSPSSSGGTLHGGTAVVPVAGNGKDFAALFFPCGFDNRPKHLRSSRVGRRGQIVSNLLCPSFTCCQPKPHHLVPGGPTAEGRLFMR